MLSRHLFALAIATLLGPNVDAEITLDATAAGSTPAGGGLIASWSHTVGNESNRILIVGVTRLHGATASVTYGATNLTKQVISITPLSPSASEIWTLNDPPPGTATIVVRAHESPSTTIHGGSVSFAGVDQTTPIRATSYAGESKLGAATNVSVTVPSRPGDLVIDCASCERGWLVDFGTSSAAQTVRWIANNGFAGGGSTQPATAESMTMSWYCGGPRNSFVTALAVSALSLIPASAADLIATKTGEPLIQAGGTTTYDIRVSNGGPDAAQNVALSDNLPAQLKFISITQNEGLPFGCTHPAPGNTGLVVCTVDSLSAGASASFRIAANVPASLIDNTIITNTASVASTSTEVAPVNNTASTSGTVAAALVDLSLTIETSAPPHGTGHPINFTIRVHNSGTTPATDVTVRDEIPEGTALLSSAPSQGSCYGTSTVVCALGTIPAGGTATVSLVLRLPATPGTITNTATVTTSSADAHTANNAAVATIIVTEMAAIRTLSPIGLFLLALGACTIAVFRLSE